MKRLLLSLLVAAAVACGSGSSGPAEPVENKTPPLHIVSGTFDVTAWLTTNACERTTLWDGAYDVVIDSLILSFGSYTGSWNPEKYTAIAEGPKNVTVTRSCTATRWTTVYITFLSEDKFRGTILYRLRFGGQCSDDRVACSTSWNMVGVRRQE